MEEEGRGRRRTVPQDGDVEEVSENLRQGLQGKRWKMGGGGGEDSATG